MQPLAACEHGHDEPFTFTRSAGCSSRTPRWGPLQFLQKARGAPSLEGFITLSLSLRVTIHTEGHQGLENRRGWQGHSAAQTRPRPS